MLSLDNGRKKKKLNPLFTNNKIQLPFSFLVHVSWFFLCIFFFTYKGYANSFQISLGSFHFKTLFSWPTAIENSGTFSDSTFVSNELISTNNSPLSNNKLFFFSFFYGCYIQAALVEYLTTWVPVEHKRDKPIIRMQNFYFMQNFNEIFY